MSRTTDNSTQTFGEHLDELRKALTRTLCAVAVFMLLTFYFKDEAFSILLSPCRSDFATFRLLRQALAHISGNINIFPGNIELITTDISSQFMAHLSVSFYLGAMLASPYILFELMRYITPALYEREKKYAYRILGAVYVLFLLGMLVSYWVLFPISCRFLATYSVSPDVKPLISLDSYMSLFISLTVLMGIVFQLPVLAFSLAKMGVIDYRLMSRYRRHAFVLIVVIAAIITPPDVLTLIIVSLPLYVLYEACILGIRLLHHKETKPI